MATTTHNSNAASLRNTTSLREAPRPVVVEDLAFTHWQYQANEKAYANKLITKTMYEFAREELRKSIDQLSKICYSD